MNKIAAREALKDAAAAHRAFTRWLRWCDGLHAAKVVNGLFADDAEYNSKAWKDRSAAVERAYLAANPKPGMPSKNRKHRMYDDIYRAAVLADVDVAPGSIRDMEGVARVIAQVTSALASAS